MKFDINDAGQSIYVTADGDMVDAIAFAFYGTHEKTAEAVLDANRGLAAYGPVLPAGVTIILPAAPPAEPKQTIELWD